jgi:hypothetical protein
MAGHAQLTAVPGGPGPAITTGATLTDGAVPVVPVVPDPGT